MPTTEKTSKSHYLYDQFGHVREGTRESKLRKNPYVKGKHAGTYRYKYTDTYAVSVPQYILHAALHFTRHAALQRHERGAPPKGCETHTTPGFIRGCVAVTAYIACLLRPSVPASEREELVFAPATSISGKTGYEEDNPIAAFRETAILLLGLETVQHLEAIALDRQQTAQDGTPVPSFFDNEFSDFVHKEIRKGDEMQFATGRSMRDYRFTAPNELMQYLTYHYRVRWGSLSEFLCRAMMHLAWQTKAREARLTPEQLIRAPKTKIDYRDLERGKP